MEEKGVEKCLDAREDHVGPRRRGQDVQLPSKRVSKTLEGPRETVCRLARRKYEMETEREKYSGRGRDEGRSVSVKAGDREGSETRHRISVGAAAWAD